MEKQVTCSKCKAILIQNSKNFHKTNLKKNNGYHYSCKPCRIKSNKDSDSFQRYLTNYNANYYKENKEKERIRHKKWVEQNKDKRNLWFKKYRSELKNRLSINFSNLMRYSLKKNKTTPCFHSLPYTVEDLIEHLESKFKKGMSWDNYGDWHIDHIRPIASFNFSSYNDKDFIKCWGLHNLQPLWARENQSKGSRYESGSK